MTPWISDGTPFQWITPVGETTQYTRGASVQMVPDMWFNASGQVTNTRTSEYNTNDPGNGSQTYYYTNAQSARLMFYHDHAEGMTRLAVYAGAAAGYLLTDVVEQDLIHGTDLSGVNPFTKTLLPDYGIPLIVQDKTFVDATTIAAQDPNWKWGTSTTIISDTTPIKIRAPKTGDLWTPSVYMPARILMTHPAQAPLAAGSMAHGSGLRCQ